LSHQFPVVAVVRVVVGVDVDVGFDVGVEVGVDVVIDGVVDLGADVEVDVVAVAQDAKIIDITIRHVNAIQIPLFFIQTPL